MIVGENDSGKTGLLKIMYAATKSIEEFGIKQKHSPEPFKKVLSNKLGNCFNSRKGGIGRMVRRGADEKLSSEISYCDKSHLYFSFSSSAKEQVADITDHIKEFDGHINTIFLPAKEVLSIFKTIEIARDTLFIPEFDDTYYDLVKSLKIPTKKGKIESNLVSVNQTLERVFEGEVQQKKEGVNIDFIFKKGKSEFPMSFTAEGVKKIGILTTLIRNRQLHKDSILFMDEPDSNLHPKAIRELCEIIYSMSKAGVQIFISTHNYFMIKQLSIIARRQLESMSCISLSLDDQHAGNFVSSDLKDGLPENSIVAEALKMIDEEIDLDLM
ncbi:ATP-binding protein [Halosquirtibacter laminarini]|uniref:ATP-binding protein n=1 Tax=Halosquirtibacter laminarini TaxID=3374600 RepID=A0AC61NQV9_9BACT|nr:ATP-binding protein [Prolixibacteraceae bacterium]